MSCHVFIKIILYFLKTSDISQLSGSDLETFSWMLTSHFPISIELIIAHKCLSVNFFTRAMIIILLWADKQVLRILTV